MDRDEITVAKMTLAAKQVRAAIESCDVAELESAIAEAKGK